jgi:hypothetical protein
VRGVRWLWLLVAITVLGGALRAREALSPDPRQSTDERSYVAVALNLADTGRYGRHALHWPPGAPTAFATAAKLSGARGPTDIPAAYWVQWLAGTALIPLTFFLTAALAADLSHPHSRGLTPVRHPHSRGLTPVRWSTRGAGLVAAAVVATYPPLVEATGNLLSEPLGALWLTAALVALARDRAGLAGALLAAAVLTRANLLVLIPVVAVSLGRRGVWFAAVALVPVVAWSVNVGAPVTTGGGSSLFVGTFLPGGGTLPGAKRELAGETVRRFPKLRGRHARELPGDRVMDAVAARRPGLERDAALRAAALHNLATYPREQPLRFAGMVAAKLPRLWLRPSRTGARTDGIVRIWHALLVLTAFAGVIRSRRRALLAVLAAFTLFHLVAGAMPRYALPLLPALLAAGAAGWVAQPRTTSRVRPYSAPPQRASISAGPPAASASRTARRRVASSSATQLATPSPAATASKETGAKSSGERS